MELQGAGGMLERLDGLLIRVRDKLMAIAPRSVLGGILREWEN